MRKGCHLWARLLTIVVAWFGLERPGNAEDPRLNVVFILADDLGWADTTLYGHTRFHETPHLARLAQRGVTFTRAYSASPLCSPTRSAIMTGLSPARTGITTPNGHVPQVVLKASVPERAAADQKAVMPTPVTRLATTYRTLASTLRDAGYATAHFGKWHLGSAPYSPREHGFDLDLPGHSGPGPAGSYVAPWKFRDFAPRTPSEHIEDRMASEAIVPVRNPAFDPRQYDANQEGVASRAKSRKSANKSAPKTSGNEANEDAALLGWKARASTAQVVEGNLVVRSQAREPFLGFAVGKLTGDSTVRFRLRSSGGSGKVAWLPSPNAEPKDPPKPVEYSVKAGDWVEIRAKVPAREGVAGILRIYLPGGNDPDEIDWIELTSEGRTRRWDFGQ